MMDADYLIKIIRDVVMVPRLQRSRAIVNASSSMIIAYCSSLFLVTASPASPAREIHSKLVETRSCVSSVHSSIESVRSVAEIAKIYGRHGPITKKELATSNRGAGNSQIG
jgi:hypothetical protein